MLQELMVPQNDFSAGELNADAKRSDDPLVKAGARQLKNWRILNSRKVTNRAGRLALFPADGRTDEVLIAPGTTYYLVFGNGTLKIRDSSGAQVASQSGYAWSATTAPQIVWTKVNRSANDRDVVMCFPGQNPKIARWSASTAVWSFVDFAFSTNADSSVNEPFYRLAPPGMTIVPSAVSGTVTVTASIPYFTAGMAGTIVRYVEHQILLTVFTDTTHMTGTVLQQQPVTIGFSISGLTGTFNVGDIVGSTTLASETFQGQVVDVTLTAGVVTDLVIVMSQTGQQFATSDNITGPHGTCTAGTVAVINPAATTQWDEEVINANRGWPKSCFFDQGRLGFCDLPATPGGVAYSQTGIYDNFLVGANPTDPFFEIAPDSAHVYHVVSKGDEFFITDRGIYYCPINASNPLKPGSLQFLRFSADQASSVRPVQTTQAIVFVNAGLTRIIAIVVNTHSLYVPWNTQEVSLYHSHLINSPVALAVTSDGPQVSEQYLYVLNADGTLAVGKFDTGKEWAGFVPWNGGGTVNWISSLGQNLILTETYTSNNVPVTLAEKMDGTQYVDGAVLLNAVPTHMQSGVGGDGPLWWLKSGTVDLIDGTRTLGLHSVDASGNVIKLNPNEDLSSSTIVAGKAWNAVIEPFVAHAAGGQNEGQRVKRRKLKRVAVSVENSTGFVMSGIAPLSCNRRIAAYNVGDNQEIAPPLRETTYSFRTRGRTHDPRVVLTKDLPGPLTVVEIGIEATV